MPELESLYVVAEAQRRAKQTEIKRVSVSSEQGFRQMCSQMCTTSLVESVTALLNSEDLDGADSSTGRFVLLVYKSILECSWDSIRADPCFWIHVADAPMPTVPKASVSFHSCISDVVVCAPVWVSHRILLYMVKTPCQNMFCKIILLFCQKSSYCLWFLNI